MDDSMSLSSLGVYSKYSNQYIDTATGDNDESNSYMNFDSYLKLLVSQMQNQDFNDPMKDSEVLNQMAQYSMLEGIKNMTQQSNISYATSLVGKIVTVSDGYDYYTGKVESVVVSNGEPALMIGGKGYSSSTVSDIVDEDVYKDLYTMVGKNVQTKTADEESLIAGKVTDVVFYGGNGYVVINGKDAVPVELVEIISDTADTVNSTTGTGDETIISTASVEPDETLAIMQSEVQTYETKSQSLIDTFMKELDAIEESNSDNAVSETAETTEITEEYALETAQLEIPDYAAGVFASGSIVTSTVSLTNVDNTYNTYGNTNTGVNLDPATAARTADGKLKGVTTSAGISTSNCVPHRISVENYPEQAALADKYGTRMYDIRYINNTAITSRIKKGEIIGRTQSGRGITEIGYSGVGQLGEVVTFEDGTQRVEVLLKSGKSCWYETSGKYTLDEICSRTAAPGSLTGKLTPVETAIRHFSHPMEDYDTSALWAFKMQLLSQGGA